MGTEQFFDVNGVQLCAQAFGEPGDPAILLLAGSGSSMDWWDERFCAELAAGRRLVIRYDLRDTGRSVTDPVGAPSYSLDDLAADAGGLIRAFGLPAAHLVGISMGGMIAQRLALAEPDLVASLTLIATSPAAAGADGLPPIADRLQAFIAEQDGVPDWDQRGPAIELLARALRVLAGPDCFDEDWARRIAGQSFDRTRSMAASQTNHLLILGHPVRDRLPELATPTLVLHGTEDPMFGIEHGQALAREIPGAQLLPLPGVGHQPPPPPTWQLVIPAILRHTAGDRNRQADQPARAEA